MLRIGLTGGIGSGKSVVARILETMGFPVFYSDEEARRIVESNPSVKTNIIELIGPEAYQEEKYNRTFVSEKVFRNSDILNQLNQIIHPAVRQSFELFIEENKSEFVFNEAAIFFETGAYSAFDETVLVCAPKELKISRIQKRDGLSREEIILRMEKQWSDDKKRELASFSIENDESHSVLEQIQDMLTFLRR